MAKKKIGEYYRLCREIRRQKNRLERLRNKKQEGTVGDTVNDYRTGRGIPIRIEGIPKDELSRPAAMRMLEEDIEKNMRKSKIAMEKIDRYIQSIEDPKVREVMRNRFLDCLSWEEVGKKNHIAPDYARQIVNSHFKQI